MTFKEYIIAVRRTDIHPEHYSNVEMRLGVESRSLHALMGMVTEVGELMDVYKKYVMYNKTVDAVNIHEELGDILWYIALFADENDLDLEKIMETNIAKLKLRYSDKFTEEAALNRQLDLERILLEKNSER